MRETSIWRPAIEVVVVALKNWEAKIRKDFHAEEISWSENDFKATKVEGQGRETKTKKPRRSRNENVLSQTFNFNLKQTN